MPKIGDKFVFEIDRVYFNKKGKESRYGFKGFGNFVLDATNIRQLVDRKCIVPVDAKPLSEVIDENTEYDKAFKDGLIKGKVEGLYELWDTIKWLVAADQWTVSNALGKNIVLFDDWLCSTPEEVIEKVKAYRKKMEQPVPTNRDKFEEMFPYSPNDISRVFSCGDNGIFIPDSWMDKPYEGPEE